MANTNWRNSVARCPYYVRSDNTGITCGNDTDNIRRSFPEDRECSNHFHKYCCQMWQQCPHKILCEAMEAQRRKAEKTR